MKRLLGDNLLPQHRPLLLTHHSMLRGLPPLPAHYASSIGPYTPALSKLVQTPDRWVNAMILIIYVAIMMRSPSLYPRERHVLQRSRSFIDACGEDLSSPRPVALSRYRYVSAARWHPHIYISTYSIAVHSGGCERNKLVDGRTGTRTDRPLPGSGPKPR